AADEQMLWNRPELPEVAGVREALLAVLAVPDERAVAQENLSVASDCAEQAPTATELCHRASFMRQLTLVAGQCRSARLPLSLIAVETREAPFTSGAQGERLLAQLLDTACQSESRAESFSEE